MKKFDEPFRAFWLNKKEIPTPKINHSEQDRFQKEQYRYLVEMIQKKAMKKW